MKNIFNIFSPKQPEPEVLVQEQPQSDTSAIIEQIHNEFYTAADNLLEEARKIIASVDDRSITKAKRLEQAGFHRAREANQFRDDRMKVEMSRETVELIELNKKKYPNNKFITNEQATAICEKYNLFIASGSRYRGFVPEKNLQEIEKFLEKYKVHNNLFLRTARGELYILENAEMFRDGSYGHIRKRGTSGGWPGRAFQFDNLAERGVYGADHNNVFGMQELGHISGEVTPGELMIAAPMPDLDLSGMTISKDRVASKPVVFPDPVVLHPVPKGYIIVTAWGDEAEDPIVKS